MKKAKERYITGLENIPGAEDTWGAAPGSKRTSLDLPLPVWQAVKLAAIKEGVGFKAVVIAALTAYISAAKKGGRRGR